MNNVPKILYVIRNNGNESNMDPRNEWLETNHSIMGIFDNVYLASANAKLRKDEMNKAYEDALYKWQELGCPDGQKPKMPHLEVKLMWLNISYIEYIDWKGNPDVKNACYAGYSRRVEDLINDPDEFQRKAMDDMTSLARHYGINDIAE